MRKSIFILLAMFIEISCQNNVNESKYFASQEDVAKLAKLKKAQQHSQEEGEKFLKEHENAKIPQESVKKLIEHQEKFVDILQKQKSEFLTQADKKDIAKNVFETKARIQELKKQLE